MIVPSLPLQDGLWVSRVHFPVVFLQVVLGDHPFVAQVATKLKCLIVHYLVLFHHTLCLKCLVTNIALKCSFLCVCLAVFLHVTFVGEGLLAEVTVEAFLPVLLFVHNEVVCHLEALPTDIANIGLVFLMLPCMLLKCLHVVKDLLTLPTFQPIQCTTVQASLARESVLWALAMVQFSVANAAAPFFAAAKVEFSMCDERGDA